MLCYLPPCPERTLHQYTSVTRLGISGKDLTTPAVCQWMTTLKGLVSGGYDTESVAYDGDVCGLLR
jgi:hypothetical protein